MWNSTNDKCEEMLEYVAQFDHCLIKDKYSLDFMIISLKDKAKELDDKYPRFTSLCVERPLYVCLDCICCRMENPSETNVIILFWERVRGIYGVAEEVEKQNKIKEICID